MKLLTKEIKFTEYRSHELPADLAQLVEKAKEQTNKSYAIYSNFHVGAAAQLANGIIVCGNNQENAAYPSGLCAERTAVFYANSQYPDIPIDTIAIAAAYKGVFLEEPISPCGGCRQVLLESENRHRKSIRVVLYGTTKTYVLESIQALLPFSFGKEAFD